MEYKGCLLFHVGHWSGVIPGLLTAGEASSLRLETGRLTKLTHLAYT